MAVGLLGELVIVNRVVVLDPGTRGAATVRHAQIDDDPFCIRILGFEGDSGLDFTARTLDILDNLSLDVATALTVRDLADQTRYLVLDRTKAEVAPLEDGVLLGDGGGAKVENGLGDVLTDRRVGNRRQKPSERDLGVEFAPHLEQIVELRLGHDVDVGDAGLVVVFEAVDLQLVELLQLLIEALAQVPGDVGGAAQAEDGLGAAAAGVDDVLDDLVDE